VQFHFVPGYRSHRGRLFEWGHGFALHTCVLRPHSRGSIRLTRDGSRNPEIDFNFLSDERDALVLLEGVKLPAVSCAPPRSMESGARRWPLWRPSRAMRN
jgi:choline dehydrogenase-like flavoprotein